jgi:c-di-GMP-binding flagellar brake protein YcgR
MLREIATRFTRVIAERRAAPRKKVSVAIRVRLAPSTNNIGHTKASEKLSLSGSTYDISTCGAGLILPSIRVNQDYLVGQDRLLIVEMDIHDRTIVMKAIGRRYEEVGEHLSVRRFIVGVEIVDMTETDRDAYEYFIKNARKLRKQVGDIVELGQLD